MIADGATTHFEPTTANVALAPGSRAVRSTAAGSVAVIPSWSTTLESVTSSCPAAWMASTVAAASSPRLSRPLTRTATPCSGTPPEGTV